jgi:beta-glucosidase
MCSYNRINGSYSCENAITLSLSLKQRMNFSGFVVSDWGATHSTVASANAGLDVEMPVGVHFSEVLLKAAVDNGSLSSSVIDDKVARILTAMYSVGLFDHPNNGSLSNNVTSDKNNNLARRIAAAAAVILKNDNSSYGQPLLPIPTDSPRIAVIGSCASTSPLVHGQGSGEVDPPYIITLLQGVIAAAPGASITFHETHDVINALKAAHSAAHVVIAACTVSGEGHDRTFPSKDHTRTDSIGLSLPAEEDALIDAVSEVSKNVVVVVTHPGAILLPWAHRVAAIICMTVPGQEAGNAAADVLFGRVNPSGRLPITMPFGDNDMNMTHEQV